jgi:urea transport system permease protein
MQSQLAPCAPRWTTPTPPLPRKRPGSERLLTIRFDPDSAARVAAIDSFGADLGLDLRAALNPLVATRRIAATEEPPGANIARELTPRHRHHPARPPMPCWWRRAAPRPLTRPKRAALAANIEDGTVAASPAQLTTSAARDRAYTALEAAGTFPSPPPGRGAAACRFPLLRRLHRTRPAVTAAAQAALDAGSDHGGA